MVLKHLSLEGLKPPLGPRGGSNPEMGGEELCLRYAHLQGCAPRGIDRLDTVLWGTVPPCRLAHLTGPGIQETERSLSRVVLGTGLPTPSTDGLKG